MILGSNNRTATFFYKAVRVFCLYAVFLYPAFLTYQVNDSGCALSALSVLFPVYVVIVSVGMWSVVRFPGVLLVPKLSLDKLENVLLGL